MCNINTQLIPEEVLWLLRKLKALGYEAYIVGGAARDILRGCNPHDWDIATNAVPEQIKECFNNCSVLDIGIKHGTVNVLYKNNSYEITTYRIDGEYSDNRHPDKVCFTNSIVADLARRDFTINAIAVDIKGNVIDPFGGKTDLNSKCIRAVGNPSKRFNEDGLRILRGLRFASKFGFYIEKQSSAAMLTNKDLIQNIAYERVASEFKQILMGQNVELVLNEFRDIIAVIIPEIKSTFDFEQHNPHHKYDVYQHIVKSVQNATPDLLIRLAMFFHDIGKPSCYSIDEEGIGHFYGHAQESCCIAECVLRRLLFDNDTVEKVVELVKYHDMPIKPESKFVLRMLNRMGEKQFRRLLQVNRSDISAQSDMWRLGIIDETEKVLDELIENKKAFSLKDLAINGNDLLAMGIPQGTEIGRLLNLTLDAVIDGLENGKETLLDYVKKKI